MNRALLVVDMQNGFCHPQGADCCAVKTRRLHELSLEVLSSYQLADIASVTEGYDAGAAPVAVSA
jgi:nicotinamidase-related amidase